MSNDSRVPAGIPAGGQFAAQHRPEAAVTLGTTEQLPVTVIVDGAAVPGYATVAQVPVLDARPGDPVGYAYQAENVSGPTLVETLIRQRKLAPAARDMPVEEALDQLFEVNAVDRDDETSYDTDEFPKRVFDHQLECSDTGWAGTRAPEHWVGHSEFPECVRCGQEFPDLAGFGGCNDCGEPVGDGDAARAELCGDCYQATLTEMAGQ